MKVATCHRSENFYVVIVFYTLQLHNFTLLPSLPESKAVLIPSHCFGNSLLHEKSRYKKPHTHTTLFTFQNDKTWKYCTRRTIRRSNTKNMHWTFSS